MPKKCATGYYTLKKTASSASECIICPAGYYCDCTYNPLDPSPYCDTTGAIIALCPAGYTCPEGTGADPTGDASRECPQGYFCPLGSAEEIPCKPGYICDGTGNTDLTMLDCPVGYYCKGGTTSATKLGCEAGYFCPINSHMQVPCEIGFYNDQTLSVDSSACLPCPAGASCSTRGQATPSYASFSCEAGYYCESDLDKDPCPAGYYCPINSATPTVCPKGYYTPDTHQSVCTICPAGFYCGDDVLQDFATASADASAILADSAIPCMAGQYCPRGSYLVTATQLAGVKCSVGTYNPYEGAENVGDCINCPEGKTCLTTGIADVADDLPDCTAGTYCPNAATSKNAIQCPKGAYCEAGAAFYSKCPVGTYQDIKGATSSSDCTSCDVNYYCSSRGIAANGMVQCGAGYICTGGTMIATPISEQGGDFCPAGHYCTAKDIGQQVCAVEYYQPNKGHSSCIQCHAGMLCDSTQMTAPNQCAAGHYCPAKTSLIAN